MHWPEFRRVRVVTTTETPGARRVLLIDVEPGLAALLQEWLAEAGCRVVTDCDEAPDLVFVDIPFPRQRGAERIRDIAARHPRLPLVALSSSFFAGIDSQGAVAQALGVAGVLPKPVPRAALSATLQRLLPAWPS
jgi:CheY-like chemotaxis protein